MARIPWDAAVSLRAMLMTLATGLIVGTLASTAVLGIERGACVALVLGCALAFAVGTSLSRRIKALTAHVNAIKADAHLPPLEDRHRDEIGVLARSFDAMSADLEERVRDRTEELSAFTRMLAESEELNRTIIDHAGDGIFTANEHGVVLTWSAGAERIFRASADDVAGTPLSRWLARARVGRTADSVIFRDGTSSPVDVRITEVARDSGPLLVGVVRDLTQEKQAAQRLAELNSKLVDASRLAGMADVASGILHNVGNVLNSVNVSVTVIDDVVKKSSTVSIGKLAELFAEQRGRLGAFLDEDERGQRVPDLLSLLAKRTTAEREKLRSETAQLKKNIDHIREIVAMQQAYTSKSGVREPLQLVDILEDAIEMSLDTVGDGEIEVVRDLRALPIMLIDRHRTIQIVVNLLRNARHAVRDARRRDPRISVSADANAGRVRVTVADNGVGIDVDSFQHLFEQGFTTKSDGHGYGLHSSANAAKDLGGSLAAFSDGPGCGARFVLDLPIELDLDISVQEAA